MLNAPAIISVKYLPPDGEFTPRSQRDISDFIIHHTAGPVTQMPQEIDAEERHGAYIYMPYTWLVDQQGHIYAGRPELAVEAASYGRHLQAVSCCAIGNFEASCPNAQQPTKALVDAITQLCLYAHRKYPISRTYAHGDIADLFYAGDADYATLCCGSNLRAQIPEIRKRVFQAFAHKGA